jgi:hypothetical protein
LQAIATNFGPRLSQNDWFCDALAALAVDPSPSGVYLQLYEHNDENDIESPELIKSLYDFASMMERFGMMA